MRELIFEQYRALIESDNISSTHSSCGSEIVIIFLFLLYLVWCLDIDYNLVKLKITLTVIIVKTKLMYNTGHYIIYVLKNFEQSQHYLITPMTFSKLRDDLSYCNS